ncbi:MAG: hypothetical protein K6C36_07220 [Clostridia bacterium]|nr:hypothetical protein [Clostridia bacterium]
MDEISKKVVKKMDGKEIDIESWSQTTQSWIDFLKLFFDLIQQFVATIMEFIGGLGIGALIGG